MGMVWSRFV